MSILSEFLSSKVRAELLRLLFGANNSELHMREMARQAGCAIGTMQTELARLRRLDLILPRKDGNRTYYRANIGHPLYSEIHGLVLKTVGLVDVLRQALGKSPDIKFAFVFGSIARNEETAGSDIDLLVIGRLGLRDLVGLLTGVSEQLGREINPHVMSVEDLIARKVDDDHFITHVVASRKIFIIGNQDEFETMG
ncbi:MAG TPA: toxin-antitoxin system toxin subunit [Desulfobulbaceae bacterium]|nr:MAG: toxin-antitoxin system toxin subunit [Deltaproteobacteria bacterium RIFOXYD12_FULL_53_23]HCC54592.1 toxin-antitoxin system toxin subunit [Desulfobulbaceae bacterium]